jgi:hypothetical protein
LKNTLSSQLRLNSFGEFDEIGTKKDLNQSQKFFKSGRTSGKSSLLVKKIFNWSKFEIKFIFKSKIKLQKLKNSFPVLKMTIRKLFAVKINFSTISLTTVKSVNIRFEQFIFTL